jgi:hypothetical protein
MIIIVGWIFFIASVFISNEQLSDCLRWMAGGLFLAAWINFIP